MLEGVLILKKLIHKKSLSYAPSAINRNKLCPWFTGSLSKKLKFSFTSNHNVVVWPQMYKKDIVWPN